MRVLQVCAEMFPLLKTGGLADVTGALPRALAHVAIPGGEAAQGAALNGDDVTDESPVDMRVLLPGFDAILAGLQGVQVVTEWSGRFGAETIQLLRGQVADGEGGDDLGGGVSGPVVYAIRAPSLYQRPGGPYAGPDHQPFADNHLRFALLGWVAGQLASGVDPEWTPAVVHAHDWHAGLAPAYVRHQGVRCATVFTVHNLAYQGCFGAAVFGSLDLPASMFQMDGLEYHGQVSFMKAGLYFADRLTTVSPTYAQEICGPEQGCGLDGVLRAREGQLHGVLNGVDEAIWNPATDALLPIRYRVGNMTGKARCKAHLRTELGLDGGANGPLVCVVSRLTEQKGLHLVLQTVGDIVAAGAQFALIGSGDAGMEAAFVSLADEYPGQVSIRLGYDEAYAHRLIAASDVILVPSRFEPCGLTQLYGLKYGCLPLVRRVGGLADTVVDTTLATLDERATGFVFDHFDVADLREALKRALGLWRRPADWKLVQRRAMQMDFGWDQAARDYAAMYRDIAAA